MNSIEDAILRTVLYADVFNFPLTLDELHHFLIAAVPYTRTQIAAALRDSRMLAAVIVERDGFIVRADRADLIAIRALRECAADDLLPRALRWGKRLARLPFVRMVAITGALSMRNCSDADDDLDYMIVTAAGRVWLTRLLAVLAVRIGRLYGVTVCPNYVVAESALTQERKDLFVAHEVTQVVPIYGLPIYERMRAENAWVFGMLPNADGAHHQVPEYRLNRFWRSFQRVCEWALSGSIGDQLEAWEYRRKLRRFATEMQRPHSAAKLDEQQVKGHFQDHGHPVLIKYRERLRQHHLDEAVVPASVTVTLPLAGD